MEMINVELISSRILIELSQVLNVSDLNIDTVIMMKSEEIIHNHDEAILTKKNEIRIKVNINLPRTE